MACLRRSVTRQAFRTSAVRSCDTMSLTVFAPTIGITAVLYVGACDADEDVCDADARAGVGAGAGDGLETDVQVAHECEENRA